MDREEKLKYSLGGLLYAPAMNKKVPQKIKNGEIPCLTSMAFCLEDTIQDDCLEEAEKCLGEMLREMQDIDPDKMPLVFIRIRTPEHMRHVVKLYEAYSGIITGYILPKYDLSNMEEYMKIVTQMNEGNSRKTYVMPILETRMVADIATRAGALQKIKELLDTNREYILNVRVGGNDFCNLYGLRRLSSQTIYDIGVIRDIFVDIINIFAADYVVSGPVWEYFGMKPDGKWDAGLMRESELDRINGFIGKTAIHPSQLPVIFESMKVRRSDYDDALGILGWNDGELGVAKSKKGDRMNEVKVHRKWAKKIVLLAEIYGMKEEQE
uniref:HpcH/HpaI aldolase/citrate lyase family protein n=1 Tax=Eubacterium cellulosolvens TaxID=29322 RepID=UPI000489BA18|nr:HpcH/HpaI aldolase/citrate lyase family protein [[Eubacterium] cellulosolvens]